MTDERMSPMQRGPNIPWSLAEKIYNETYSQLYPGYPGLTPKELSGRGGFGWAEVEFMYKEAGRSGVLR